MNNDFSRDYHKNSFFRDKDGKNSSKRIVGLVVSFLFVVLASVLFVYSLNSVVADPETILRLLEMLAYLVAGLLGVGVLEGAGKWFAGRNRGGRGGIGGIDDDDDYYGGVRRNNIK